MSNDPLDIELLVGKDGQRFLKLYDGTAHIQVRLSDDDLAELRACVEALPKTDDNSSE